MDCVLEAAKKYDEASTSDDERKACQPPTKLTPLWEICGDECSSALIGTPIFSGRLWLKPLKFKGLVFSNMIRNQ